MEPDVWQIELGTAGQIVAIQSLELRAGELFREIGLDSIADEEPVSADELRLHLADGTLWVVRLGDEIVGYLTASVVDGEGHIDQVSVDPTWNGRGIGSALIETACDWARSLGLVSMTLTTFEHVEWNGPFYRRRGFKTLDHAEMGPELVRIRQRETSSGIDVEPRIAMRRYL